MCFVYLFKVNRVWKWKVLIAEVVDYTYCKDEVKWMFDPDFTGAEAVCKMTPDLVAEEFVFDTEKEALECVANFYKRRTA